jgi:hypothetical protein
MQRLDALIRKLRNFGILVGYLVGKDAPAYQYLENFRQTATQLPIPGAVGGLCGYSSLTVVAHYDLASQVTRGQKVQPMVVKFESRPGKITFGRLADEQKNETLARKYLDGFMPPTYRLIGHGIRNEPSALVYQQRIEGKPLCQVRFRDIRDNAPLLQSLSKFCDAVLQMHQEVGQVPDLAGSLPRVDWLTNLFWRSRHVFLDFEMNRVWFVDTGFQSGQESTNEGPMVARFRTWLRLQTLKWYQRKLCRRLAALNRSFH